MFEPGAVGPAENYFIQGGYRARLQNEFFDDTGLKEEYQKEVYQFAREIADREGLRRIADVGCGSGYKLMRYFQRLETVGYDLGPTVEYLRKTYPDREWRVSDFSVPPAFEADLVICADVIEHLPDPVPLVRWLESFGAPWIVISTPDRSLFLRGDFWGPPANPAHVREWTMAEFRAFMSDYFTIEAHFISNGAQATQCLLARPRGGGQRRGNGA